MTPTSCCENRRQIVIWRVRLKFIHFQFVARGSPWRNSEGRAKECVGTLRPSSTANLYNNNMTAKRTLANVYTFVIRDPGMGLLPAQMNILNRNGKRSRAQLNDRERKKNKTLKWNVKMQEGRCFRNCRRMQGATLSFFCLRGDFSFVRFNWSDCVCLSVPFCEFRFGCL